MYSFLVQSMLQVLLATPARQNSKQHELEAENLAEAGPDIVEEGLGESGVLAHPVTPTKR